jgi:hypothetical protein
MSRTTLFLIALLAAAGSVVADDKPKQEPAKQAIAKADTKADKAAAAAKATDAKTLAGISILGNQDSPKSLVIVPWKGSEIGDMPGLSRLLDDSIQPVDKDVFMRELTYYQIRQGKE